jgi:thiamine kinase-like enzyme
LSSKKDFQLEQCITTTNLEKSRLTLKEKCHLLAHTLSNIHCVDLPLAKLDLEHDWCYYITLSNRKYSAVEQQELTDMLSYWRQESVQMSVLCHNDLAFAHVTEAPNTVVFDWEYSALSNPFFDIASCITINQLNNSEQDILLMTYADYMQLDMAHVVSKVGVMLPIVAKTNELWSLAFVR